MKFDQIPVLGKVERVTATVGSMSLMGTSAKRPVNWGNYFWLRQNDSRVVNFWAENLVSAKGLFLPDSLVKVVTYGKKDCKWSIVFDERIPLNWYYPKLYFTGCLRMPREFAAEAYDLMGGDPENELEFWDDPVSYYAKRGGTYNSNGTVFYNLRK
jgi:hypothetical protein